MNYAYVTLMILLCIQNKIYTFDDWRYWHGPSLLAEHRWTAEDQRRYDQRQKECRAWIQSILDGATPWTELYEEKSAVSSAVCIPNASLLSQLLAHKESKALINGTNGEEDAPLYWQELFGTKETLALLFNEPTIDLNKGIGCFDTSPILYAIEMMHTRMAKKLMSDARVSLWCTESNIDKRKTMFGPDKIVAEILDHSFDWHWTKKLLIALISRKDFPAITNEWFDRLKEKKGSKKDLEKRTFLEVFVDAQALQEEKQAFLAKKRQEWTKRKAKVQRLSAERILFYQLRAEITGLERNLEQEFIDIARLQFGLLRDLSAYDLQ